MSKKFSKSEKKCCRICALRSRCWIFDAALERLGDLRPEVDYNKAPITWDLGSDHCTRYSQED